jgi:DNA-directed RNA polymerase specialized sigma24 family protein
VTDGHDFDAIYRETGPRLWRALLAFSAGRRHVADDALAEAFARAMERGRAVREPEPYLFRVAFRVAAQELKQERGRTGMQDQAVWDDPRSGTSSLRCNGCRRRSAPACTSTTKPICRSPRSPG